MDREPRSTSRRRTLQDLRGPDPEIPWLKAEKSLRDLVCALMERQDRMNEALFFEIADLRYRIADLEDAPGIPGTDPGDE